MLTLLVFGSVGFWLWLAAALVFEVIAVANDWPGRATLGFVVFLCGIHFLGGADVIAWILAHGIDLTLAAGAYLAVGTVWAVMKWYLFMRKIGSMYIAHRVSWLQAMRVSYVHDNTPVPPDLQSLWERESLDFGYGLTRPAEIAYISPRDHKSRITTWIGYWPFSALWTLIDDPVRALVQEIYTRLTGLFRVISDRAIAKAGVTADLKKPETPPADRDGFDAPWSK